MDKGTAPTAGKTAPGTPASAPLQAQNPCRVGVLLALVFALALAGALSQPHEAFAAATEVGDFLVEGGEPGTDYAYEGNVLAIKTGNPLTVKMKAGIAETTDRIEIVLDDDTATANMTLSGVKIDATGSGAALIVSKGALRLVLADGTESSLKSSRDCAGLQNGTNALEITGGIAGTGSLAAQGGSGGAGIGMGGGVADASNITVSGGTVTATGGGFAAGIGCGLAAVASNITVSGGTVTATGGTSAAGIGGGNGGYASNITVSGGTVTATGGNAGAGIGGGDMGYAGSSITVSGGLIRATGNRDGSAGYCADIGSGHNTSYDSSVTVSGGLFADQGATLADADSRGLVYDVVPVEGCVVAANPDPDTSVLYPVGVYPLAPALGISARANLVYDGFALAASDFDVMAKRGGADASGEVVYAYRAQDADPWIPGLPKDAGDYAVRASLPAVSTGSVRYPAGEVECEVTIGRAPLSVTARDASITYGDAAVLPGAAYAGFVGGEDASVLAGELGVTTAYEQGDPAGTYPIAAAGLASDNYAITYTPGMLTVERRALTLRALDAAMSAGGPLPALNFEAEGLAAGDKVIAPPVLAVEGDTTTPGTCTITIEGGAVDNQESYDIAYVPGTLTVGFGAGGGQPDEDDDSGSDAKPLPTGDKQVAPTDGDAGSALESTGNAGSALASTGDAFALFAAAAAALLAVSGTVALAARRRR